MCSQGWTVAEQTSYSLRAVGSSSQKTQAAEGPVEELVGPMVVVVVVVGVALDPRCSEAAGSAPAAAEPVPRAVGAEAEEALGPRGLNWAEVVEEGLGLTASMEAVPEAVLGSSLTAAVEL